MPKVDEDGIWIELHAERLLYVDYGNDVILCDRFDGPRVLVLKVRKEELAKVRDLYCDALI